METIIKEFLHDHLYTHILLIALSVTGLLVAMSADLFAGIRKARQRGEARTSKGLKKTADKAMKYFLPYLVLVCADILCSIVVPIPIFSMVWAAYCIYCEFKSVREKAWEKAEIEKAEKTVSLIIENKDELAKDIAAFAAKLVFDNAQSATVVSAESQKPKAKKSAAKATPQNA